MIHDVLQKDPVRERSPEEKGKKWYDVNEFYRAKEPHISNDSDLHQ